MAAGWPGIAAELPFHSVDIRDAAAVNRVFAAERPEVVFHLAAQPLVRRGYREPVETFAVNVMGTVHVLEAARTAPSVLGVVVVTSDKCYENREWHWGYRETDAMGGFDPYSASKGCAELVAASYRRSYTADGAGRVATGRAGNVIGGGDWAEDRLVPDILRSVLADKPVRLRRPEAIRPWQHVLEPLSGYLALATRLCQVGGQFADGWNFGPSEPRPLTVREVAERLVQMAGRGEVIIDRASSAVHEAHYLRLDSSKAAAELGWVPLLSTDDRLAWTLDWFSAWRADPTTVWRVTQDQIGEYERRIVQCPQLAQWWCPASPGSLAGHSHAA